ncbi:MAG: class I SAM-dependent methyltransferase [Nitrospinota bacterium]
MSETRMCIICANKDRTILEDNGGLYKVIRCNNCGLVYVDPLPPEKTLAKAYSKEYYVPWIAAQKKRRIKMWQKRLDTLDGLKDKGKLLDIGCGEGLFLEMAKKDGWDVQGTEVSPFSPEHIIETLDIPVFHGELHRASFPDKTFDAVTMWHVLEHTVNPLETLIEVKRIIRDDGIFILAVPNLNNIVFQRAYRIFKGKRIHLFDPKDRELHIYHFTSATIQLALERSGFQVIKIRPDNGIVDTRKKAVYLLANILSRLSNRIVTDAIEVISVPSIL